MEPMINKKPGGHDNCQTPGYAIDPLIPFLPTMARVWEPAAGEGYLVKALKEKRFAVWEGDVLTGEDYFKQECEDYEVQVTNPPFSMKFKWLQRAFDLDNPFALLLPINTLGTVTAQKMFEKYGISVLLLDKRIDFKMPFMGWDGQGAQFSVAWFMWKLADPGLYYGKVTNKPKKEKKKRAQ